MAFSAVVVWGSFAIELGYFVNSITHKRTKIKEVALTFDDGPTEFTPKFLDLLQKHQVKATFFCIGNRLKNIRKHFRELLQKDIPLEIIRCHIPIQQVFYLLQK
jgi:peptidoglycan/xylan/chitin deacetylase (PgdA/CDA1 family)